MVETFNAKNNPKKCWLPWRMFRIMSDGNVSMCCSNRSVIGNIEKHSFEEIWNGQNAVHFRTLVNEGKYVEAGCATCAFWYTFNQVLFHFPEAEFPLNKKQYSNRIRQIDEYLSGKTCLNSRPSMLFIQPSYQCNLKCIMCNQKHVRIEGENTAVMPGLMKRLQQFEPEMEEIILQGGEPLLVPEILEYLEVSAKQKKNFYISLNTNGQLYRKHENLLKQIRFLKLNFSVDAGSKSVYEKIRIKGDWNRLVDNIHMAARLAEIRQDGWFVNIQNLVMKSNIEHLEEMITFWEQIVKNQKIYPVLGADNETENVFIYNHLLDQTPQWRYSLDQAIDRSTQSQLNDLSQGLLYCRELLDNAPFLSSEIHTLLVKSMNFNELTQYYEDVAGYKVACVNGFTDKPYHHYIRLSYPGIIQRELRNSGP